MTSPLSLWRKLKVRKYRKALVAAQLKQGVPFQIRALRKQRGWSQERLAQESGLTQGVISRAEDPDYGNLTFNTVLEIANGFDVAFVGRFVPFSDLARWFVDVDEDVSVPTFVQEDQAFFTRPAGPPIPAPDQGRSPQEPVSASRDQGPRSVRSEWWEKYLGDTNVQSGQSQPQQH